MAAGFGVAAETEGMMRILDFFWPYEAAEPTAALADEAVSAVGIHADRRRESLARLREMEKRLDANIQRESDALAAVRAAIAREEEVDIATAAKATDADFVAALEEIKFAAAEAEGIEMLVDCTATTAPAKRGCKRKLTEITSEAA